MTKTARFVAAGLAAGALLLAGCSSDTSSDATSASPSGTSASPSPTSGSPSPTDSASPSPTEIAVVLCDKAEPETVKAIEAVLKDDFTVSQLVDVRTDDGGTHAILGFVEGPGLAVLAQWTGTGTAMTDIASVDDFAEESSTAPRAETPDEDTQRLLDNTVGCYTTLYGPDADKDKKDKDKDN